MRGIIGELKVEGTGVTVVDMEAGLELFGRGTPGPSDLLVAVIEPSLWSIQTALRVVELARELAIPKVLAVANKVREDADVEWIRGALAPAGVDLIGVVPYDPAVSQADRTMRSLLDIAPASDAARAIAGIVDHLESEMGPAMPPADAHDGADDGPARPADDGCPWVVDKY